MTSAAAKTTKRKKATGPKYQARWQAAKRAEANMPEDEKTYKQRLNDLLSLLEQYRVRMPVRSLQENMTLLSGIIAASKLNPAPPRPAPAAETPRGLIQ